MLVGNCAIAAESFNLKKVVTKSCNMHIITTAISVEQVEKCVENEKMETVRIDKGLQA